MAKMLRAPPDVSAHSLSKQVGEQNNIGYLSYSNDQCATALEFLSNSQI